MEYRDVHDKGDIVKKYLDIIDKSSMSESQIKNIHLFVEELKIGKNSKHKVKNRRIAGYLQFLARCHEYFKKDLDKITEEEATEFYKNLDGDRITRKNGMKYSDFSKTDFVKSLKRYLGWLWGKDSKAYERKLRWMKEYTTKSKKNAITIEQCQEIIAIEKNKRDKALFSFGFDSGGRIEEILNVKIKDLSTSKDKDVDEYYIVHLRGTKTENADRTIPIPLCKKELNEWIEEYQTLIPEEELEKVPFEERYLFPINYDNARRIIKKMSKKVLGFQIKPHELRHSSATHYIQYGGYGAENIGGFYYRYGWMFGSQEALTYIKQYLFGGKLGHEKVVKSITSGRIEELEKEVDVANKVIMLLVKEKWKNKNISKMEDVLELIKNVKK